MNFLDNLAHMNEQVSKLKVEKVTKFKGLDLSDLCSAVIDTLKSQEGFSLGSGSEPPHPEKLEKYFQGVLLVPERELFVGRLDGTIAGSLQLVKPSASNKTSDFAVLVDNHFVAPWARGHGLARKLLVEAEKFAKKKGFTLIKLSAREDASAAVSLYESCGYRRWGVLDKYERSNGKIVAGYFYCKEL